MSVEEMCTGSTLVRQTQTHTLGASGGDVSVFTDGDSYECHVQEMSSDEAVRYDSRGERSLYTAYFAEDPGFTVDDRAKLSRMHNVDISPVKLMRVLGQRFQGNPDGDLALWIVSLEEVTNRYET